MFCFNEMISLVLTALAEIGSAEEREREIREIQQEREREREYE